MEKDDHSSISHCEGVYGSISIKDAVNHVFKKEYRLPSLQRNFIWKHKQIENLFNSIMLGFPINLFIFWKPHHDPIEEFGSYEFLTNHKPDSFDNLHSQTKINSTIDKPTFVIDGQQRLTSLYFGLMGSYKFNESRSKQETKNSEHKLYLNLTPLIDKKNINSESSYSFKFLSQNEKETYKKNHKKDYGEESLLFEITGMLKNYNDKNDKEEKIKQYLIKNNIRDNSKIHHVKSTLNRLFDLICEKKLIHYYQEQGQNLNNVLEMFIRINSGGIPLSRSDLIFSIICIKVGSKNNEDKPFEAREEITKLIKNIRDNFQFEISKEFILKTYLVLFSDNIRFLLKNFNDEKKFDEFKANWKNVKQSIELVFRLLKRLKFDNKTFKGLNVLIPIIYHIYYCRENYQNIFDSSLPRTEDEKRNEKNIFKYLYISFIKGIFGKNVDGILKRIKKVFENIKDDKSRIFPFPIKDIVDEFSEDTATNYNFDDDTLCHSIENAKKDDPKTWCLLYLLYADKYSFEDISDWEQDHMHPKNDFKNSECTIDKSLENDIDSLANLQLLRSKDNRKKHATSLKQWVDENRLDKKDLFLEDDTSLELKDFQVFIQTRRKKMFEKLQKIIKSFDK